MPAELTVIQVATLLIIGFSVFAAAILLIAYLYFLDGMSKTTVGKLSCSALLFALTGLQLYHCDFLLNGGVDLFNYRPYVVLLLATPPTFFFFSREILIPEPKWTLWQLFHLIPVALGFFLPISIVAPVAFTVGAGYSIWFARIVYGLRRHVKRFRFEMFFFGFFAILAVLVLVLFILVPYLDTSIFYIAYANFTGVSLLLIVAALIVFPEMLGDITEVARIAYAKSTLKDVEVATKVDDLQRALVDDGLYQNENLNLKMLAEAVDLSGHQLSELINTQFGVSFSRHIRERRVAEAKRLLCEDSDASILSISLMTGFRSQSNFYAAFREITGVSPGQYRRTPD